MDIQAARSHLIDQLRREIHDQRVLEVMGHIPRELFIPVPSRHLAYDDIPLPIEEGQTISQPFIIALMTEALELRGNEKVLEIGTGSGYQAAILAELTRWVISVERFPRLAEKARELLAQLGYTNVEVHLAGETLGWQEGAPYDGIIVTAGAPRVPEELVKQLAENGRMVIPVGSRYDQNLMKLVKRKGELESTDLGGCRFVPLIGKGAWSEAF